MSVLEKEISPTTLREDWLQAVDRLYADVEGWAQQWLDDIKQAEPRKWTVRKSFIETADDYGKAHYHVPVLEIYAPPPQVKRVPEETLVFKPIVFNAAAGIGRIDFYAWPAHYRVRLLYSFDSREWIIKTDSGLNWPHAWSKETFIELAEGLLRA